MITEINRSKVDFKVTFHFLNDKYNFKIIEESESGLGFFYVYANDTCKIGISYDYRDNFISIDLVKGKNTQYPNDLDSENIKDIYSVVEKYDIPNIQKSDLQPTKNDYTKAMKLNAEILEQNCSDIFQGKNWL